MGYLYILLSKWLKETENNYLFFCQHGNKFLVMIVLYNSGVSLLHCFQMEKSILGH